MTDKIVPWSEVNSGDLVLIEGELTACEGIDLVEKPWGDGTNRLFADVSRWHPNGYVSTIERLASALTAVRREAEG